MMHTVAIGVVTCQIIKQVNTFLITMELNFVQWTTISNFNVFLHYFSPTLDQHFLLIRSMGNLSLDDFHKDP